MRKLFKIFLLAVVTVACFAKVYSDNVARDANNRPDEIVTATLVELLPAQPAVGSETVMTSVGVVAYTDRNGVAHSGTITGFDAREAGETFPVYLYDGKAYGQKKFDDPYTGLVSTLAFMGAGVAVFAVGFGVLACLLYGIIRAAEAAGAVSRRRKHHANF